MNVALPLLPIGLVALFGWILSWRTNILDLFADGQLYFFSVTLCAAFGFDAVSSQKIDALMFAAMRFALLPLMTFYAVSMMLLHGGEATPSETGQRTIGMRKLALASIVLTLMTVSGISYGRLALQLI